MDAHTHLQTSMSALKKVEKKKEGEVDKKKAGAKVGGAGAGSK